MPAAWSVVPSVLALALVAGASTARASELQLWNAAFLQTVAEDSGPVGWLDLHARRGSQATQVIVRPAAGWQFLPDLAVHAGYAWIPTSPTDGPTRHEQRAWSQLLWTWRPAGARAAFSLRPRLEHRFSAAGPEVGHRARVFARAQWTPRSRVPLLLAAWNEAFFVLNDSSWAPPRGFDQNRLFVGVGFPVPRGPRFEVGYLNLFLHRTPQDRVDHVMAINAFYTR